jgi:hypothetical protein
MASLIKTRARHTQTKPAAIRAGRAKIGRSEQRPYTGKEKEPAGPISGLRWSPSDSMDRRCPSCLRVNRRYEERDADSILITRHLPLVTAFQIYGTSIRNRTNAHVFSGLNFSNRRYRGYPAHRISEEKSGMRNAKCELRKAKKQIPRRPPRRTLSG